MKKIIAYAILAAFILSVSGAQARGGRTTPADCTPNSKKPECVDTDDDPPAPPPPPKKPG